MKPQYRYQIDLSLFLVLSKNKKPNHFFFPPIFFSPFPIPSQASNNGSVAQIFSTKKLRALLRWLKDLKRKNERDMKNSEQSLYSLSQMFSIFSSFCQATSI